MEDIFMLVASHDGVAALGTVSLALSMLIGTFSFLAYKAKQAPASAL